MPFQRVEARRAGPGALGILVPPGRITLVILRPRGLPWDLLPVRWDGDPECPPSFCQFSRDEAAGVARGLFRLLEKGAAPGQESLQTLGKGDSYLVWWRTDEYDWIVCRRVPGETYRPLLLSTREEAVEVGRRVEPVLRPAPEETREVYFNTQLFAETP